MVWGRVRVRKRVRARVRTRARGEGERARARARVRAKVKVRDVVVRDVVIAVLARRTLWPVPCTLYPTAVLARWTPRAGPLDAPLDVTGSYLTGHTRP